MKIPVAMVCLLAALAALSGCKTKPPEIVDYEVRDFDYPANLVDLAVLDSGAAPGAVKEEYERFLDIVDFFSPDGRIIRVESTMRAVSCRVFVSHAGTGGPKGAKEALNKITKWIEESEDFMDHSPPKRGGPKLP